jgi:hypothetical protein
MLIGIGNKREGIYQPLVSCGESSSTGTKVGYPRYLFELKRSYWDSQQQPPLSTTSVLDNTYYRVHGNDKVQGCRAIHKVSFSILPAYTSSPTTRPSIS